MHWILALPFALQGIATGIDEFYFHHRRGLGFWEEMGHSFDTLFFILPLAVVIFFKETHTSLSVFIALAIFSTLFITKDEWIHHDECSAGEQWLHSVLFILHPIVLFVTASAWPLLVQESVRNLFTGFFLSVLLFLIYQTTYWNLYDSRKRIKISKRNKNQQSPLQPTRIPMVSRSR